MTVDPLAGRVRAFVDNIVIPRESELAERDIDSTAPHREPAVVEELRAQAKAAGLWALHYRDGDPGRPRPMVDYLPIAVASGRSRLAPLIMNSMGPDAGNMDLLHAFGTPDQQQSWLAPLLAGEIRSCFAMTEPAVAGSDARNVQARIAVSAGTVTVTARKWWITAAADPNCAIALVAGKTDWPGHPADGKHSIVLVPMDSERIVVHRRMSVLGFVEDHAEIEFDGVEVPLANVLGEPGAGLAMMQERLVAARLQHSMRMVGLAERGLEVAMGRAAQRVAFGKRVLDQPVVRDQIAEMRISIELARSLVASVAAAVDDHGLRAASPDVAMAKIAVPRIAAQVIDQAMQICGGVGLSEDLPLSALYAHARVLRIADGPEDVHKMVVARREINQWEARNV